MTTALRTNHIQDEYERPVPGASIYVYNADGSLAALTSNGTTSITNPLTSDAFGNYSYYAVVGYYREDVWFGGKLRWSENNVAVGSPGADLTLRSDLTKWGLLTVTPQQFGAKADGATDDSAAFVAAIAYLKAFALNTGAGGFYKGSPKLFIPAGHYYLGTTALDINHSLVIEGEGSGRFGPGAGGCTHLRWGAATDGIRIQGTNTNGNTGVDSNPNTHDGAGGVTIRGLCLEGGYVATESDHHGLVVRTMVLVEDCYIKNFPGEGIKCRAGNQNGGGTLGGNDSECTFFCVKLEGNRIGLDIGGSDANIIRVIACTPYQNRQAGIVDDNGAGSNIFIACHAASNGLISGAMPTQCTNGGNQYALKYGGDPTIAPSGTTADTANWLYNGAGGVDSTHPAWVATPGTFRYGGDYLTTNSASTQLISCYSENGGFSQFTMTTSIDEGSIGSAQFRGGWRWTTQSNGVSLLCNGANPNIYLDNNSPSGVECQLTARRNNTAFGLIDFVSGSGIVYVGPATSGHIFETGTPGAGTVQTTIGNGFLNIGNSGVLQLGGVTAIDASRNAALAAVTTTSTASTGVVTSSSATAGIGYATGAGGAVTQITSRTTSTPAINKLCGQITLFSAAGTATWQTFTVPNTTVAATDSIRVIQASGTDKYMIHVTKIVAATSFDITFATTGGTTTEQPVFNFAVLKAVAA